MLAAPAHNVGAALTLPTAGLTQPAEGPLGVTVACWEMYFEGQGKRGGAMFTAEGIFK